MRRLMSHGLMQRTTRGAVIIEHYIEDDAAELWVSRDRLGPPTFDLRDAPDPNGCDLHASDSARQGYTDRSHSCSSASARRRWSDQDELRQSPTLRSVSGRRGTSRSTSAAGRRRWGRWDLAPLAPPLPPLAPPGSAPRGPSCAMLPSGTRSGDAAVELKSRKSPLSRR